MRVSFIALMVVLILAVSSCTSMTTRDGESQKYIISQNELNSNIGLYEGKQVTVEGYLVQSAETLGLWANRKSYEDGDTQHCVVPLHKSRLDKSFRKFNKDVVVIHGIFVRNLWDVLGKNYVLLGPCNMSAIKVDSIRLAGPKKGTEQ